MVIYIYGLLCPLAQQIRYIGKSDDPDRRYKAHIGSARKPRCHKTNWLAKLMRQGLEPELRILREVPDGADWAAAEREEIAKARALGWPLTNMTLGGEGAALTEEGLKARLAIMGSADVRAKMSASALARWTDPELAAQGRAANASPEKRKKLSERAKRRSTPEYRAMMAAKSRAAWADKDKRARIVGGITDETREKVSTASKRFWATSPNASKCLENFKLAPPDCLEKARAALKKPEVLEKRRATMRSPEYRERQSQILKASWERRKKG